MEFRVKSKSEFDASPAYCIEEEIKAFVSTSDLNLMPPEKSQVIFDEPLVRYASGDDPLFQEYKKVVASTHLTPVEALSKACNKEPQEIAGPISVISWILPITGKTRRSMHNETLFPSRLWSYTRWYGEIFNDALKQHIVDLLTQMGYLAAAPSIQPYFKREVSEKGIYSNWSERHAAFAAGHGTFSLSDGFITGKGIAHRCGSVVANILLPPSPRTAESPYSNCLFYIDGSCKTCVTRCPGGAITEKGHDKQKCFEYSHSKLGHLKDEYNVKIAGCGLCQTKVPCESKNPAI